MSRVNQNQLVNIYGNISSIYKVLASLQEQMTALTDEITLLSSSITTNTLTATNVNVVDTVVSDNLELSNVLKLNNRSLAKYISTETDIDLSPQVDGTYIDAYPDSVQLIINNIGSSTITVALSTLQASIPSVYIDPESGGNTITIDANKSRVFMRVMFNPPIWEASTTQF